MCAELLIKSELSYLPLYSQVEAALREYIDRAELAPGQLIPSEEELCQQFNVSRNTVRRALDRLVSAGVVRRVQGKGTFVAEPRVNLEFTHVSSVTAEILALGARPGTQLLRVDVELPSPATAQALGLKAGQKAICLDRLRFADETPIAVIYDRLPFELVPNLGEEITRWQSLFEALEKRYGIVAERCEDWVSATLPSAGQAKLLEISENTPVLSVVRTSYTAEGVPVQHSLTLFRADMWRYHISAKGPYTSRTPTP